MYNLDDIKIPEKLTPEFVYKYLTDEQLFRFYIKSFKITGKPFTSEIRKDKNPSACIYATNKGLRYKDFAEGSNLSVFDYIMLKYGANFHEALRIIATDFSLLKANVDINPRLLVNIPEEESIKQEKLQIFIEPQSWNLTDYKYWREQYQIPFELLDEYDVKSAKKVFLKRGENLTVFNYSKNNPIYAYKFCSFNEEYYKIYFPLKKDGIKWIFNGNSEIIQGYKQLPEKGDLLIITKSLKDILVLKLLDYNAIAPQSEISLIKKDKIDELKGRFSQIITFFDADLTGIKGKQRLNDEFGLKSFVIPLETGLKDVSDYIKENGLKSTKNMIENELRILCS